MTTDPDSREPVADAGNSPPAAGQLATAELAAALQALGAETPGERRVKRIIPWVASVALHLVLVLLGFAITWTVVLLQRDQDPVVIVADFDDLTYEPLAVMGEKESEQLDPEVQDRVRTDDLAEALAEQIQERLDVAVDPMTLISNAASISELSRFAPEPPRATATFVGLSSSNAQRIVYVIDASGSMIGTLPIVLDELTRSLDGLGPKQEFSVVFFQRNRAIVVPPDDRLSAADDAEKQRVLAWIDEHVIPSGRSNPLAALRHAIGLDPDVIFLLSDRITGSGEFEIDQADLLDMLDRLNPVDRDTGRRGVQINCIQFLDPDELDTLRRIAAAHGGARGYKFLDRAELGLRP